MYEHIFAKYGYHTLKTVTRILVTDRQTDGRTDGIENNTSSKTLFLVEVIMLLEYWLFLGEVISWRGHWLYFPEEDIGYYSSNLTKFHQQFPFNNKEIILFY